MTTNKVALRSVEQFMAGYTPIYQPIYPLFMGRAQQYAREVGEMAFRRVETIGDIRAHRITPKDTEMKQISVAEGKKYYKRYFKANQFVLSNFQDAQGVEEVTAQVLDEHQLQFDEQLLTGDGTSVGTQVNNGLFWSQDANYVVNGSEEIDSTDRLYDFHADVMTVAEQANALAGQKLLLFYGSNILPLVNSLFPTSAKSFRQALQESLGADYSIGVIPAAATPSSNHGLIIANLDQTKLHYTVLPELMARGQNEEKMYVWSNFLMGSCMLEVLAAGGVIRQPLTLE